MKRDMRSSDPAVTPLSALFVLWQAHTDDNEITGNQDCLHDTSAER